MKKKVLGIALTVFFLALLVAPAIAGKGQTKLSFRLVLVGTYGGTGEVKYVGQSFHHTDMPFVTTGWWGSEAYPDTYDPIVLEIDGVAVDPALLSYEGMMKVIWSEHPDGESGQPNIALMVDENITIGEAGKLVLQVKGNNYAMGKGAGDSFIGLGTGAFEGVKIQGRTPDGAVQVGELDLGGGTILPISKLERVGTVMGWP